MKSPRSVRNGASSTAPSDPALIQRLLVEGQTHRPDAAIEGVAAHLEQAGIIVARRETFVKCRNEMDRDYAHSRQDCSGLVPLHPDLDEEDGDIRCPKCDRVVRPKQFHKQTFPLIAPVINHAGVGQWMEAAVKKIGTVHQVAPGVWSCQNQAWTSTRFVVLIEQVDDQSQYVTEQWAQSNQVVFVAINPDLAGMTASSWATPTPLAALVAGALDLGALLDQAPEWQQKPRVNSAARLYSTGRRAVPFQPAQPASTGRQFIVELADRSLLINGQVMLQANATSQMAVFRVLLRTFAEDLCENAPVAEFRSMTIEEIAAALPTPRGQGDVVADETARTHINRFQREIVEKWRKQVGSPINDQDIIQTMIGEGREGYRINPTTVLIRPRRV